MGPRKDSHVIMVGMSRAGTTFMYHNLRKHPDLFLPSRKEIGYFAHHYDKGEGWYRSYYDQSKEDQVTVDICGVYFSDDNAISRIKNDFPESKIILSFRDPYEWIFSLYEQYEGSFRVPSFEEFLGGCVLEREGKRLHLDFTNNKIRKRVEEYMTTFEDRIFLYDFAEFERDPLAILCRLESFMGVRPWFSQNRFTNKKINARGRNNSGWFDRLLQQRGVIDLILTVFPRSLVLKARNIWELKEASESSTAKITFSDAERASAHSIFASDHEFYTRLFKDSRTVLGAKKPVND